MVPDIAVDDQESAILGKVTLILEKERNVQGQQFDERLPAKAQTRILLLSFSSFRGEMKKFLTWYIDRLISRYVRYKEWDLFTKKRCSEKMKKKHEKKANCVKRKIERYLNWLWTIDPAYDYLNLSECIEEEEDSIPQSRAIGLGPTQYPGSVVQNMDFVRAEPMTKEELKKFFAIQKKKLKGKEKRK